MPVIQFQDVWEMYRIKFAVDGKASWESFWALRGLTFEVEKGEAIGIIGENGAGKSTILKLISGILKPDRGEIKVSGRVSGLLELGVGFQPELTGKENVYFNAGLLGFTPRQIDERYAEIVNFADIGKFIHAPVKCYSQGMFVRLAFAIAIHVDSEILLIDDTLAVGDEYFQRKCIKKIFEIREQGKTIIFVTHDMNMLARLCRRAIFLKEGSIVKNNLTDKVIPLYTQMVGSREGVGILEKGPLNVIFNNGRFFLDWKDRLLTPHSGAYTFFCISERWYNSFQADWEVSKENENKLIAKGRFHQLGLTQTWILELVDEYAIKWGIHMESQDAPGIQEGYTNIVLTNEYDSWFTALEQGVFPQIDDNHKRWYGLLNRDVSKGCIGVRQRKASDGVVIPSLSFERDSSLDHCQANILNTDYLMNSRVLQYKTNNSRDCTGVQSDSLIYFSGKIVLDIRDMDNYLSRFGNELIASCGKLKIMFENGILFFTYEGRDLTKASHVGTSLCANGKWYLSSSASWEVKKDKDNSWMAIGRWSDLDVIQKWDISIVNEDFLIWKIDMKVIREIEIEQQYAWFMCSKDYVYWCCDYGSGVFPERFLETETDMVQRCIPDGTVGLESGDNKLPTLTLRIDRELSNFAKIFNSDFYNKARILRIGKVEPEEKIKFLPGEYRCLNIEAVLDNEKRKSSRMPENILENGRLKFIFDNGRGRIYWDGLEITKRLGLYTSLRSRGRWHDSVSSAIWKIRENKNGIIKAFGRWLYLPLVQDWEIRLKKKHILEFHVNMHLDKKIEFDRIQTNLMLTERYIQWFSDKEKGPFFLFKDDVDDDWESIWSGTNDTPYIGVSDIKKLPSVKILSKKSDSDWRFNIVNSDIYHRGRVLQYLNTQTMLISPGEYLCFKGNIFIEA